MCSCANDFPYGEGDMVSGLYSRCVVGLWSGVCGSSIGGEEVWKAERADVDFVLFLVESVCGRGEDS